MKNIQFIRLLFILLFVGVVSSSGQLQIQGNFPFDTTIVYDKTDYFSNEIKISRYNLTLWYDIMITLVVAPNFYSETLGPYSTSKIYREKWLKSNPETYRCIFGHLCANFQPTPTHPTCHAYSRFTKGYYFIDSIENYNDTFFIYPQNVWIKVTDTTRYPVPDSILLRFDYKPGTPLVVRQKPEPGIRTVQNSAIVNKNCYTIRGVKVNPALSSSGVYINSEGYLLQLENRKKEK